MINVKIIYNNEKIFDELNKYKFKNIMFDFIDETSKKGKRLANIYKNEWGAKLSPFILVYNDDIIIRLFYSEVDKDIIKSLANYLNL